MADQRDQAVMEKRRMSAATLFEQGISKAEVARQLDVSNQSASRWYNAWQQGGKAALRHTGLLGRKPRLTTFQLADLEQALRQTPRAHGFTSIFWTTERVTHVIQCRYGVTYHPDHVWRILQRLGWSCQRPVCRALERNDAVVLLWKRQRFVTILKQAQKRRAYLAFVDEAGFMLDPVRRRTWAPRGCAPVLKVPDTHGRISVIGAITISPKQRHFAFHFRLLENNANFHGNSVVPFIEAVRRKIRGPFTLLWDQIRIHYAEPVKHYLAAHPSIVVEPFPPYAPELNPVDYVWGHVKNARLPNYTPPDLDELRKHVTEELRRLQKQPKLLKAFFAHTHL
jgi:transposase